jgi:hypothetical protein
MDIKGKQINQTSKTVAFGDSSNSLSEDTLFTFDLTNKFLGVGINTPQGAVDITSTTRGMLIPRMSTAQRNAILLGDRVISMLIFNTDATTPQFEFWNGLTWTAIGSGIFNNALTTTAGVTQLGGPLVQNTTIDQTTFDLIVQGTTGQITNQFINTVGPVSTSVTTILDNSSYTIDSQNVTTFPIPATTGSQLLITSGQAQLNSGDRILVNGSAIDVIPNQIDFTTNGLNRFTIENDGTLSSNTTNYEVLITNNNAIPNKRYVDLVAAGALVPKGTWNATTNLTFPANTALVSSTGTVGNFYVVSVAGTTTLDGIAAWNVGDMLFFANGVWNKIDNAINYATQAESNAGTLTEKLLNPSTSNINNRPTQNTIDRSLDQIEFWDASALTHAKTSIFNLMNSSGAQQILTVGGTTATIDWTLGDYVILDLRTSTGNVTLTLNNPTAPGSYQIMVIDHATTARTITFPPGSISPDAGGNTFTASLPNTRFTLEVDYKTADPIRGAYYQFIPIPNYA